MQVATFCLFALVLLELWEPILSIWAPTRVAGANIMEKGATSPLITQQDITIGF